MNTQAQLRSIFTHSKWERLIALIECYKPRFTFIN